MGEHKKHGLLNDPKARTPQSIHKNRLKRQKTIDANTKVMRKLRAELAK